MAFEVGDGRLQPDRFSQIERQADFFQGIEYLMGARFGRASSMMVSFIMRLSLNSFAHRRNILIPHLSEFHSFTNIQSEAIKVKPVNIFLHGYYFMLY